MIFAHQYDESPATATTSSRPWAPAAPAAAGTKLRKPASDFVDATTQNDDGTGVQMEPGDRRSENWDQLTPEQRAVFFYCRDRLKSNAKLASQKTQAIGICGQVYLRPLLPRQRQRARIKALPPYDKARPTGSSRRSSPLQTNWTASRQGLSTATEHDRQAAPLAALPQGTSGGDFWLDKRTSAYYCYRKYVLRFLKGELIDRQRCSHTDFPLIRYTDVILQWAEALIRKLNEFTPAKNLIDQVRPRHMPGITIGGLDAMRGPYRYEAPRAISRPEAVGYFDEVRWGTYKGDQVPGTGRPRRPVVVGRQHGQAALGTGTTASGRGPVPQERVAAERFAHPPRLGLLIV